VENHDVAMFSVAEKEKLDILTDILTGKFPGKKSPVYSSIAECILLLLRIFTAAVVQVIYNFLLQFIRTLC
jgi:hypothetical protein